MQRVIKVRENPIALSEFKKTTNLETIGVMGKMKAKKQSAKATLAEVMREMAKPRVVKSARG